MEHIIRPSRYQSVHKTIRKTVTRGMQCLTAAIYAVLHDTRLRSKHSDNSPYVATIIEMHLRGILRYLYLFFPSFCVVSRKIERW